jgi:hypothetical protein
MFAAHTGALHLKSAMHLWASANFQMDSNRLLPTEY